MEKRWKPLFRLSLNNGESKGKSMENGTETGSKCRFMDIRVSIS